MSSGVFVPFSAKGGDGTAIPAKKGGGMSLEGVKVLITGAGSGIGRAIAMRFAREGGRVAAADILEVRAQETAKLIKELGGMAVAITANVSHGADVERMVKEAVDALEGLDVLVNNAGVSSIGFMEQVGDDEIERVFGVNLSGLMRVTRAAASHLKKSRRGRIINISSVEAIQGSGLFPVYCAAKAGVLGLTRANAVEFAYHGITVNAICPGPIDTEMLAPLIAYEKEREKTIKSIPLRRLGKPEDIAGAVAFLASEDAAFINGHALVVDGGMTIKA
jgi:NAD(P)-dependent dehydrogenase (short-subunit alcohol dehydrogenase family)